MSIRHVGVSDPNCSNERLQTWWVGESRRYFVPLQDYCGSAIAFYSWFRPTVGVPVRVRKELIGFAWNIWPLRSWVFRFEQNVEVSYGQKVVS
ncbi:uncharacterized protein J3R85_000149 [Psidium guajava]|nr:uncharacterized protein J3R85_000149 [Psidium guajava]